MSWLSEVAFALIKAIFAFSAVVAYEQEKPQHVIGLLVSFAVAEAVASVLRITYGGAMQRASNKLKAQLEVERGEQHS